MNQIPKLSKFIHYVLGRHPDEFGLVADPNGFFKIKTLLQALHEEPQWKFIRRSHFNELLLTCRPAPIEIQGNLIRAVDRKQIPQSKVTSTDLPKLLYTAIRQRTHPNIATNGIYPNTGIPYVILARDKNMALRMGKRVDNFPVLTIVKVTEAIAVGVIFRRYGGHLILAEHLPPDVVISPPLARVPTDDSKNVENKIASPMKTPGSFIWQPESVDVRHTESGNAKHRKSGDWKKQRRLARKHKKKVQNSDFI